MILTLNKLPDDTFHSTVVCFGEVKEWKVKTINILIEKIAFACKPFVDPTDVRTIIELNWPQYLS